MWSSQTTSEGTQKTKYELVSPKSKSEIVGVVLCDFVSVTQENYVMTLSTKLHSAKTD